jgi:putative salt-induced outer membrane protein YdiY/sporulation protein YlmC with PRC-barrel domain
MKPLKLSLFCLLCAIVLPADTLVMKNGDRVTGSIVKKDGNAVTVKSALFGTITVPWDQVDSVKTDTPLNVVLNDGKEAQTNLVTTDGKVQVAGETVPQSEVKVLRNADEQAAYQRFLHPRLYNLWAGTGTIGLAGTAGNAKTTTFTVGLTAARATNTDKTTIYFNAIKASSLTNGVSADTAKAIRAGLGYSHNLKKKFFVNVFNDYEFDKFQSLDLRVTLGGGIGYHLIKHEKSNLDVLAGADWSHANFSPTPLPHYSTSDAEFFFGDDYSWKISTRSSLTQTFRMFNNLSNTGEYRVNFDVGANTQLFKWLTWNLAASDRYLSNPPVGRKTNDIIYTTGFGITFATK